jgi:NADH:ubiquinone oxidoreductase subunit 6 (subunit J)
MNETAAVQQVVQIHAGPLFWILALGTVIGSFAVVGRESQRATAIGMCVVVVSLGGLFAMTGAIVPALLFAVSGLFLFAPLLKSREEGNSTDVLWPGVRPVLAFGISLIVALLTITLIQGTQVWLYTDSAGEFGKPERLRQLFDSRFLTALIVLALFATVVLYARKCLETQEHS